MKYFLALLAILWLVFWSTAASAQYYVRPGVYSDINNMTDAGFAKRVNFKGVEWVLVGADGGTVDVMFDGGTFARGVRLNTAGGGSKPTCDSTTRGMLWYVASGAGVADTAEICAKAAADTYAWRAIATIP